MCDSDDDYFSDWVLDDKTLAVLDEEESKFNRTADTQTRQGANTQARYNVAPPPKRQKTAAARQPPALHRSDTLEDMEDLPDVSIRQDGTYGLQDRQRRSSVPPTTRSGIVPTPSPNVVVQAAPGTRPTTVTGVPVSRGSAPAVRGNSGAGSARVAQVPSRPPSSARGMRATQSPASSQEVFRTQSGPPQRANRVSSTTASGSFVDQLLQQIDELRKKNEAMRTDMESALDAKFVKEGEVTILRKRLEKTAQDHLAQIAKLKSARDEADAKHVLLRKQFEADKDRLRTELTFRRHELETSSRMQSLAALPKNDVSQTAGPLPTQRQRSGQWGPAGPSRLAPETPRRPRFGAISDFDKSKKTTALEIRELPSGFQVGPRRSQTVGGHSGKETASFGASQAAAVIPSASPLPQESSHQFSQPEVFGTQLDDDGLIQDFGPQSDVGVHDAHMVDEGTPAMTVSSQENMTVLALPSRNVVLHDIMVTHTLQGSELPTLQLLVCASPKDTRQVQSYGAALMRIFDTIGGIPAQPDKFFDDLARIICYALCEITDSLAKNNLIAPLTAVLNLLTKLAYMSSSIHALLLRVPDCDEAPQLLEVLHSIVQGQLQKLDAVAGNEHPELCSLGKETLSLYEALVSWIPDDLEDRQPGVSKHVILSLDITPSPAPVVVPYREHVAPYMVIDKYDSCNFSSLPVNAISGWSFFRSLLAHSASGLTRNDGEPVDAAHHPQISLVCSLLTDTDRQGPEADELKSHIIMFFGMLSNAHPDAYTLLVESQELIPSIIIYLCHLATPIWHENEMVFSDPLAATRTIDIINHATLLLYHLVTSEDMTLDLRERLLRARAKTQEAPIHYFILTFGRLSYADPPHWLDVKDRQRLVGVGALARALLERVIQGPELDLIWETYQYEGEETNETDMDVDEEEVEAQIIANA